MKGIIVENVRKVRKAIPRLEAAMNVKVFVKGDYVSFSGGELEEYIFEKVLMAVDFGFDADDALLLRNPKYVLKFVNMKDHTRRKNLSDVRARVIGTRGKARKTIEELSGAILVIRGNKVGVIVRSEHLDSVMQALVSLIQGSKHGNVFSFLEKQNANLSHLDSEDLGLRSFESDKG